MNAALAWSQRMSETRGEYSTGSGGDTDVMAPEADAPKQWFAMVPAAIIRDKRLTSGARDVLLVLILHADVKSLSCHPKQSTIGDELGISREEVNRRLRKLKELGYVTSDEPTSKGGTSTYHLHLSPPLTCDQTVTPSTQPVMKRSQGCDQTVTPHVIKRSHRTYPYNKPNEHNEESSCPTPDGADGGTAPSPPVSLKANLPKAAKAAPASLPEDGDAVQLAACLRDAILAHSPNARDAKAALAPDKLQNWARPIDLMLRRDARTPAGIRAVIAFATADSFWQCNILSPGKLREQYDPLEARMRSRKTAPPARAAPYAQREPPPMRLDRDRPMNAKPKPLE